MGCGRVLLWTAVIGAVLALLCYLMYPDAWHFLMHLLWEDYELTRRQWERGRRAPAAETEGTAAVDGVVDDDDNDAIPEEAPEAANDVVDYTPAGSRRVQILHPQTPEALARLVREAQTNARVVRQMVVTSSSQYPGVSAERPILVNTYGP